MNHKITFNLISSLVIVMAISACGEARINNVDSRSKYWIGQDGVIYYIDLDKAMLGFGKSKEDSLTMATAIRHNLKSDKSLLALSKVFDGVITVQLPDDGTAGTSVDFKYFYLSETGLEFSMVFRTQNSVSVKYDNSFKEVVNAHKSHVMIGVANPNDYYAEWNFIGSSHKNVKAVNLKN